MCVNKKLLAVLVGRQAQVNLIFIRLKECQNNLNQIIYKWNTVLFNEFASCTSITGPFVAVKTVSQYDLPHAMIDSESGTFVAICVGES